MSVKGSNSKVAAAIILYNFLILASVSAHNLPCTPPKKAADEKCPKDTLKFGVCGSWLGLVTEVIGTKPSEKCCTVVKGLADLEAALCLCTAIKANVLGIVKLNVHVSVTLLVNACGKKVPDGFVCA